MTNDNPLIILRNQAIMWIIFTLVSIGVIVKIQGYFNDGENANVTKIEQLDLELLNIKKEGVITQKKWEDLSSDERKKEQWSTMQKLVPHLSEYIGTGTDAGKNLSTMMSVSNKVGSDGSYISWLEKSWTDNSESILMKNQADIAEIIPVFSGSEELSSTENIAGKITLKSLNNYIQKQIVDQFGLQNAFGKIGIESVRFLDQAAEIGIYEIPLKFEKIPSENALNLLQFLGKTGGITLIETGNDISIKHKNPLSTQAIHGESGLKNLLITVSHLGIVPTKNEKDTSANISASNGNLWDISITLQFYIRGVSNDYVASIENSITTLLDTNGSNTSLITQGNTLLKKCSGCAQSTQIRDILNLLSQAQKAYTSIIIENKTAKTGLTPITILEQRTKLLTTLQTLQNKLTILDSIINNRN